MGTNVRQLADHAYHPTWQPDGMGLVFLRENKVIHLDLATGDETLIQDGSTPPLEDGSITRSSLRMGG